MAGRGWGAVHSPACYLWLHSPPTACRRIPWLAFLEPTHTPFGTTRAQRGVFLPRPFRSHCESKEEQVSCPGGGFWGCLEPCASAHEVLASPASLDGEARRLEPQSMSWALPLEALCPWNKEGGSLPPNCSQPL